MNDPIPRSASSPDELKTEVVPPPVPAELIHQNAGRILGEMLSGGGSGMEQAGDLIGPYRLCELLGEGGFGNVWRAEQTEIVRREVAVKVIKPGMDSVQVLGRFNQERQALASLDHPNIATMLDAGVSPNGRPYFAMELVRGGAITHWCAEHQTSLQERLRLFIQVCLAVQHAHGKGILHRDLKPTNVLVTEVEGQPVPKVIDFGIAKAMHSSTQNDLTLLTQANQVIGTPLCMSPEQIEGRQELDARSDVYALGVLLYELLTGAHLFDATQRTQGMEAVKRLILETVPERPSTRVRRQTTAESKRNAGVQPHLSSLPVDLDWITMRALEKDRLRRYASAAELAADVQRFLDQKPVVARPASVVYKASRWIKRHRTGCIAAGTGAVLSGLVVATAMHDAGPVPAKPTIPAEVSKLPPAWNPAQTERNTVTNTLGMKFVPVPITGGPMNGKPVLFSIWETRVQDYGLFASETKRDWPAPDFEQGPAYPAVNVHWDDATAFCLWLTEREHKSGKLTPNQSYRLPSDHEWSCAVGIGDQEDAAELPEAKSKKTGRVYPWSTAWPPPDNAGNLMSRELETAYAVPRLVKTTGEHTTKLSNFLNFARASLLDRHDGYATTAPVGSYAANHLGLHDLGGNVWEWCADRYIQDAHRVWRGGSFLDGGRTYLVSARREGYPTTYRRVDCGFRVVLETP